MQLPCPVSSSPPPPPRPGSLSSCDLNAQQVFWVTCGWSLKLRSEFPSQVLHSMIYRGWCTPKHEFSVVLVGRVGIPASRPPESHYLSLALQQRVPRCPVPPCGTSPLNCRQVRVLWRAPATARNLQPQAHRSPPLPQDQRTTALLQGWTRMEVKSEPSRAGRGEGGE